MWWTQNVITSTNWSKREFSFDFFQCNVIGRPSSPLKKFIKQTMCDLGAIIKTLKLARSEIVQIRSRLMSNWYNHSWLSCNVFWVLKCHFNSLNYNDSFLTHFVWVMWVHVGKTHMSCLFEWLSILGKTFFLDISCNESAFMLLVVNLLVHLRKTFLRFCIEIHSFDQRSRSYAIKLLIVNF
jgi:hypothetical protein